MKFPVYVILCLLLLTAGAFAEDTAFDLRGAEDLRLEILPAETRVRMEGFSAVVPAGWSLGADENNYIAYAENKRFDYLSSLTFTPTTDIENDRTFVGVLNRRFPKGRTLDEIYERIKSRPYYRLSLENWNNQLWLVRRYTYHESEDGIPRSTWIAQYVNESLECELLVIAQTVARGEEASYEDVIEHLLPQISVDPDCVLQGVSQ